MTTESTPSSIVIRSYQSSYLSACQEIFTTVHRDYNNPTQFTNYLLQTDMADIEKNYLEIPNGHWWVAVSTDNNRVVGQVALLPLCLGDPCYYRQLPKEEGDQTCELLRMAVASDIQKQGVGRKLLSTLIDFAREKGYRQVYLTTFCNMQQACQFYEKNGFIKGRTERFSVEFDKFKTIEDVKKFWFNLPKPVIFEVGEIIPDDDQCLMKMPPTQSNLIYLQYYFLNL